MTAVVSVTPRPPAPPLLLDAQAPAGKGTPLETEHRQTCRRHPQRVGGDQLSPSSDPTARGGARSWALRETGSAHSPGLSAEPASPQARVCRPLNQPREGRACEAAAEVPGNPNGVFTLATQAAASLHVCSRAWRATRRWCVPSWDHWILFE